MADNTIREEIRKFLQKRADNATSAVGGVPIAIVKDIQRVNEEITTEESVGNTLAVVEQTFTIGMIDDYLGKYEPIEGQKLIIYTVPLLLFASTKNTDDYFDRLKTTLDNFIESLIGKVYQIQTNLAFATTCTEYTNTEQLHTINGEEYVKFLMTIFITKTDDIAIGNEVKYELKFETEAEDKFVTIIPIVRGASKVFTPNYYQQKGEKEAGAIIEKGLYESQLGFLLKKTDPLVKEWIKLIEDPNYSNTKIYNLRKSYWDDEDLVFNRKFLPLSAKVDDGLGEFAFVMIDIAKPNKILFE